MKESMEDLRVAAVSIEESVNNIDENLARIAHWTQRAATEGAEVIIFPELSVTGFVEHRVVRDSADTIPGRTIEQLTSLAEQHNVVICCGILERDGHAFYNTQALVSPNGLLGKQRKLHVPECEAAFWTRGCTAQVFDIGKARVGIMICFDALFAELARTLFLRGAELLIMPGAYITSVNDRRRFPETSVIAFSHRTACFSNGCYGIAANVAGTRPDSEWEPEGRRYPGWAGLYDPFGNVRAWTRQPGNGEAMAIADLDGDTLKKRRDNPYFIPPYLRADVYDTPEGTIKDMPQPAHGGDD